MLYGRRGITGRQSVKSNKPAQAARRNQRRIMIHRCGRFVKRLKAANTTQRFAQQVSRILFSQPLVRPLHFSLIRFDIEYL